MTTLPTLIIVRLCSPHFPAGDERSTFIYTGPRHNSNPDLTLLGVVFKECQHSDGDNWYDRNAQGARSLSVGDEIWLFWPYRYERHVVMPFGYQLVDADKPAA